MKLKTILQAARLRTLPLSISGILVGSALAYSKFNISIFVLSVLTTVLLQVLSNFANDYGDSIKGVDNNQRVGPTRAVQSGEISLSQMKLLIIFTTIMCLVSIAVLVLTAFSWDSFPYILLFLGLGIASVWAAIKYTIGRTAYGYQGLGDVFVFIFFGWVSVAGNYFLYTHHIDMLVFIPASAIGLLCTSVLNLNNMRDIENDRVMNKRTFVVLTGWHFAKHYHFLLISVAMILMILFSVIKGHTVCQMLYIIAFIPLGLHLWKVKHILTPRFLDTELKKVAISTFLLSVLFFIGQIL